MDPLFRQKILSDSNDVDKGKVWDGPGTFTQTETSFTWLEASAHLGYYITSF